MPQIAAQIGIATNALESVGATIGMGMLVWGFAMSAFGFAVGRTRRQIEARGLRDACTGGLGAIGLVFVDLVMRYVV